jgi:hypothetical protein
LRKIVTRILGRITVTKALLETLPQRRAVADAEKLAQRSVRGIVHKVFEWPHELSAPLPCTVDSKAALATRREISMNAAIR